MKRTVTAITLQEKNHQRVNIYLDGEFAFGLDNLLAAWLSVGKVIGEEEISELIAQDVKAKAYQRAIKYLQYRPRSVSELSRYLKEKLYPEDVITDTIDKCIQNQLLNDEQFTYNYIESRLHNRPMGIRRLSYELKIFGIPEDTFQQTMEAIQPNEDELAMSVAEKYINRYSKLEKLKFFSRLSQVLIRRGFSYDTIQGVVQNAWKKAKKNLT